MRKRFTLALLSLLMLPLATMAQNVTVSPSTGKLIAASTYQGEVGFQNGWCAMWRHEQLPLTFTVADDTQLTDGGEISNPAGNVNVYNNNLVIMGGQTPDLYCVLSLPKGYRITGYRLVLLNDLKGSTVNNMSISNNVSNSFYETGKDYNVANYKARAESATGSYVIGSRDNTEYVIERTSLTDNDMSNQLYFHMTKTSNNYYGVTIKSFEVYFTAEGSFEADVKPDEVGIARSVVAAPFTTSKIDIGDITAQTRNGRTYYAYNYQNVRDLVGYTYLYQDDAIENGVPSDVAPQKNIYPVKVDGQNLYALCNDTYYIETPIQVHTQTGLESPVGYRIVGATFNYLWGTATTGSTETITAYYITYTYQGTTYYLNDQLHFIADTPFEWEMDGSGNLMAGGRYLSCGGSEDLYRPITMSTEANSQYNLRRATNGSIYYRTGSGNYFYLEFYDEDGYYGSGIIPIMAREGYAYGDWSWAYWEYGKYNADYLATSTVETTELHYPGFTPGSYTLTIYDKTGSATATSPITVNSASNTGSYHLTGLNNDAVKFSISGLENGKQALVSVTLEIQALDPYIDKMDIVCHDPDNQLSLTQSFTADDFSVSGGKFIFYIPEEYQDKELTFTFSDLYSKYGDNTYYTNTELQKNGNARYSFVTSSYFEPINGNGNDGLYASVYNPDASYTNKVLTSRAGNIRFKFNNAENLSNTSGQTTTGYLEEYPFSVSTYLGSTDPDGSSNTGAFIDCKLKASSTTQKSGIYYVFTADETRYNIAPTKAWQHRSYAFYRMDIELQAKTYTPDFTWTKVYDHTCFYKNNQNVDNSMWGLKLGTKDGNNVVTGYLTVKEIDDAITAALGKDNCPTTADQILYVDGSSLFSVVSSKDLTLQQLKAKLAPNSLFYLPENTTSTLDNFAYKTSGGSFRAGKDIVLTDRQPFYSLYDIQVDAANKARYTREVTWEKYGATTKQSLILPFTLAVNNGVYSGDNSTFTVTTLSSETLKDDADKNYVTATFVPVLGTTTEANTPYLVDISSPKDGTFVVEQGGSLVKATTGIASDNMIYGTPVTATYTGDDSSHSFKPMGSYSGKIFQDAEFRTNNVFFYYGSNDLFRSSAELASNYHELYAYPFRAFYGYTTSSKSKLAAFMFSYGSEETDGISDIAKRIDFAVQSGKGYIQITSGKDSDVRIFTLNGMKIATEQLSAGDSRIVNLPSGVYIVNGMKVIVK